MRLTAALLLLSAAAAAQVKAPASFRLELTLRETDDHQEVKDQKFVMLIENSGWGRIRAGLRVPFYATKETVQYADIGNNLDCRVVEADVGVKLNCSIEMSSVVSAETRPVPTTPGMPVIQSRKTSIECVVPLQHETRISSLEDSVAKRKVDVLVVVQRL